MYDQDHCSWRSYKETKNSKPYFSPTARFKKCFIGKLNRRLEVMGARKNGAREGDTRVFVGHPVLSSNQLAKTGFGSNRLIKIEENLHTVAAGLRIDLTKSQASIVQGLTVSVRPSLKQMMESNKHTGRVVYL